MSGRNRGRSRGRPKGSGGGRGRGRGRACQTDDSPGSSRSPSASARSRAEGGPHVSSGGLCGFPPLSVHPGAPPGTFPFNLPPGLPHPFSQLSPPGLGMPRASSHSAKSSRHDDQSPGRVSSGMQTTHPPVQQGGFNSGRHSHDSRQMSGASKPGLNSAYGRQSVDHAAGDPRYAADHSVRPSVRKAHRQPRDFPFQEEFEPTFSGQKEKRISVAGPRHDKEALYANQKQTVDKSHKDISHRMQFQNVEPSYPKQKKDSSYLEPKHDKELLYASRRVDRDQSYGSSRVDRDARYVNPKQDREPLSASARRGRESPYCLQRQEASNRSSSTESNQSAGSPYADRDISPHCGSSPSVGYHSQAMQPYMLDSRNHSGDRDSGFSKHRDHSGERYPQSMGPFSSTALRQPVDSFNESVSREIPRENTFTSSPYTNDSHVQYKTGYSGKPGKSNKSGNMHVSYATTSSGDSIPIQRMFSNPGHPDSRLLSGCDPQADTACVDLPSKKASVQGNRGRSTSLERMYSGQTDRDKSSNRKKQTTRNQQSDLQTTHQTSYFAPSPCYINSCPSDMSSGSACVNIRGCSKSCEDDYSNFRPAKQGQISDHRPVRVRRPSTPSSPSPSPYASTPPTPPLYPSRPPSPPAFPSKRAMSKHQQLQESQYTEPCRRSSLLDPSVDSDCNSSAAAMSQTSSSAPQFNQGRRRKKDADDSPELPEPPPLIEPMAFQQQFVKHLQQQSPQEGQDDPFQGSFPMKGGKQAEARMSYDDKKQQRVREQMAKQEEQMCRDYIKMTRDKMQRQHHKQLEELQLEHTRQIEQMQRDHTTQMHRHLQHDHVKNHNQLQRERFAQEEERLQREQMKQFEKMRQDQMKEIEQMHRELVQLEQKFVDRERPEAQESARREQQELTQYQYQQQSVQQQKYQHPAKHQPPRTQSRNEECAETSQRQPADYTKHRYVQMQKQQSQLYPQQSEQQKPAECPQQSSGNGYQPPYQQHYPQQQLRHETSSHPMPHQSQQQYQQTHSANSHHHQQQQYHQPSQHQNDQIRPGQWQQQQQHQNQTMVHVQQDQQSMPRVEVQDSCQQPIYDSRAAQQGQTPVYLQHHGNMAPVPPWRQGSAGRECGHGSRQAGSGQTDGSQTVSPARLQHSGQHNIPPVRQPLPGRQTPDRPLAQPLKPTQQSPVRQAPFPRSHSASHTLASISSTVQMPAAVLNGSTEVQATFQTHYSTQPAFPHNSQTLPETGHRLEAYTSAPMAAPSAQPGSTAKKPPWQVDHENQVLCAQKNPPWQQQQQSEQLFVIPAHDAIARSVSQYTVSGAATAGHHYPEGMSAPPALTRLTTAGPMQTPQQHPTGMDISHQTALTQHVQHSGQYQIPHSGSSIDFQTSFSGLQTYSCGSQTTAPSSVCSQPVLPQTSVSSAGQPYTHLSSQQQTRTPLSAVSDQSQAQNMQLFPGYGSAEDLLKPHICLSDGLDRTNDARYQYQTPNEPLRASGYRQVLTGTATDQECAEQVLVEALNEQMNQTNVQNNAIQPIHVGVIDQASIGVGMHSKHTIVTTPQAQLHAPNGTPAMQTYNLHHLFDDANTNLPCVQTPHTVFSRPATCALNLAQQGHLPQSSMASTHEVIPGNPLDTAVALLNIPESVLDIPSIEQHQVFVLEPPSRQQSVAVPVTSTAFRRNSWHTPENSIAGSGAGSLGDDDAGLFNDITVDLGEDDDDLFLPSQSALKYMPDSKVLLQNSVQISSMGINDLGLRISSVFSLAAKGRRKRRTMSDSVLQEVEMMARQEGLGEPGPDAGPAVNKVSSQHNLFQEPFQMHNNSEAHFKGVNIIVSKEHKYEGVENSISRSSPDPLAQLTKMLFSDMASPSPDSSTVEDWNLNEAAGVSFEADSVCVPGTPVRGDPESLTTPMPHLYTPMPQLGTPKPHVSRDPATSFARYSSALQSVKMPATPGYAKEVVPGFLGKASSSVCLKDLKEPQTPWPFPVKEFKEPETPLPSCAMALPNYLPNMPVKSKEPSAPLPQCAKNYSSNVDYSGKELSLASQLNCNRTSNSQPAESVLEIRVDDFQKVISENVERASKQPLEQAIRELLGGDPIDEVTDRSFKEVVTESSNSKRGTRVPKQLHASISKGRPQTLPCASSVSRHGESHDCAQSKLPYKGGCEKTVSKRSYRREHGDAASKKPQRKSERLSAKESNTTTENVSKQCAAVNTERTAVNTERTAVNTERTAVNTERDIRDRVSDNWERRCVSKTVSSSKVIVSRSRDNSRESDKERRMVPLLPEPNVNRGTHKSKPSCSKSVSSTAEATEEDRKSCGVRGRRTITIANRKKTSLDRRCSIEDESPQQKHFSSHPKTLQPDGGKCVSEDSAVFEDQDTADCIGELTGTEEVGVEDLDGDVFFPDLSPSISTDGSCAEEEVRDGEDRLRLSSCDSERSRLSSVGDCAEVVGESIADLILPTVLPPPRRPRKYEKNAPDSVDLLATFHDHKLQCVQVDGEHYVVLEELLAKCFPGLSRSQVERARVRDLNLLTRTVHLLGTGLGGNDQEARTVMALQDASRLLHYFHAMMNCPGSDCKLKTYTWKDRKGGVDSDPSKLRKPCVDEGPCGASVRRSGSFGFVFPVGEEKKSVSAEKCRKNSVRDEDGVCVDLDGHDDTRSSSSDQTVPYCDGQPLVGWELDSARKVSIDNSDGEQDLAHAISTNSLTKKFRRHSSESESRFRKHRDSDHFLRTPLLTSPDMGGLGESSPMLPPLPIYASPFTPGSMYSVPMDNERMLMECFSAPGSQAPSSIRSAPSVRLLSPERHDHPHMEEDVFAGLYNNKSVLDNEFINTRTESQSNQQASSRISHTDSEQYTDERKVQKAGSADYHYQDFTDDFNAEEPDDDVFIDNETECKQDCPRDRDYSCTLTQKEVHISIGQEEPCTDTPPSETCNESKCLKDVSVRLPETTGVSHRNGGVVNCVLAPDVGLSKNQPSYVEELTSVKRDLQSSITGHKRKQFDEELQEKLNKIPAKKSDTRRDPERTVKAYICLAEEAALEHNLGSTKEDPLENICGVPLKNGNMNAAPVKDVSEQSTNRIVHSPGKHKMSSPDEPDTPEDKATSDATFAYGASDEDTDMHYGEDPKSERTADPPNHHTAHSSGQTNVSCHTPSPSAEPDDSQSLLQTQNEVRNDAGLLEQESLDGRRPPLDSEGSLEDRVQNFIAHTPRTVVRSNSLPSLCGMDSVPSPVKNFEDELHIAGAIGARSNSFPGAGDSDSGDGSGPQSCAPSPVAAVLEEHESAAGDKEDDIPVNPSPSAGAVRSEAAKDAERARQAEPSGQPTEPVFLDPADVVDGGEVASKATPIRSPEAGADSEPLLQWAVPCALHGSALCGCEGIDVHTLHDLAASPKVGPWLCTPGTPLPGTPFTDYSKLIYSPFHVLGGMTPARPEAQDTPAGSPQVPDLDLITCGSKRLASHEGQPAPKRRFMEVCKQGHGPGSPLRTENPSGHVGFQDHSDNQTADSVCGKRFPPNGAGVRDGNANTAEETDELFLENEERELIAAAEESEKTMANMSSEEREKLLTLSPEMFATVPGTSDVFGNCSRKKDPVSNVTDCSNTHTHTADTRADYHIAHNLPAADFESTDMFVSTTQSNEKTVSNAILVTKCSSDLISQNNNTSICATSSKTEVSEECTGKTLPPRKKIDESNAPVVSDTLTDTQSQRTDVSEVAVKHELEAVSVSRGSKACPDFPTPSDMSDTSSVGTADSESVNDLRIITLGDSDMDLTFESEDSKDSVEITLSRGESELASKQPSLESKKVITIAQYKERRKQLAESKSVAPGLAAAPDSPGCSAVSSHPLTSTTDSPGRVSSCSAVSSYSLLTNTTSAPARPSHGGQAEALPKQAASALGCAAWLQQALKDPGPVTKVARTESVPAELSRKVSGVELKRSSSLHGQHPVIKRFRHQADESLDTVKAKLKNLTHISRAGGRDSDSGCDRKSSLEHPASKTQPKVRDKSVAGGRSCERSPGKRGPPDSAPRPSKEARRKDSGHREKATSESRRKEKSEKRGDGGDSRRDVMRRADHGGSGSARLSSAASQLAKVKARKMDKNLISRCPETLRPCSVVVSKMSSFSLRSSNLKDDSDHEEGSSEEAFSVESETISIRSNIYELTSRLTGPQAETSTHVDQPPSAAQDEPIWTTLGAESGPHMPSPTQDERLPSLSPERSQTSNPEERMSVGESKNQSEDIDVDEIWEHEDSNIEESPTTDYTDSARTRGMCRPKPAPPSSIRPGHSRPQTDSRQTGSKQTDSKQTDSRQTGSKQTDSKQTVSKQTDSKQTGSKQTDSKQTDSKQTYSKQTDSKQTGSKQTDSKQTGSKQTDSKQTGSKQTESKQTGSKQTNSKQTGSKQTNSKQTGSKQTDSKQTNSKQTGSKQTGSKQTDSKQTGSKQTDSKQTDSKQTGSKQTDSKQTDSKQTDSKQTDSKQTGSKQTDSKQTNSKQTNSKQTDSKQTGSKQTDSRQSPPRPTIGKASADDRSQGRSQSDSCTRSPKPPVNSARGEVPLPSDQSPPDPATHRQLSDQLETLPSDQSSADPAPHRQLPSDQSPADPAPHRQLSDQLEALLREKEKMLAEFAARNKELEQKLEGLRVELKENKKEDD